MKNWTITVHDENGNQVAVTTDVHPDLAEAVIAGLSNQREVSEPRHAAAQGFNWIVNTIAQTSRLLQHLDASREEAIIAADKTHPLADRKAIAIAAAMPPSRLYRILDRRGRPRNRTTA